MGKAQPQQATRTRSGSRRREGLKILLMALLVALFIRTFLFEGFRIPTESMEKSLLAGDFVLVSKFHYGPRLPMSVGVPVTPWYIDHELPYARLPGLTRIRRGDAIVFNYPVDTVPVDRRLHYIKRVAGLPGDTVALIDKELYVNGRHVPAGEGVQQRWLAHVESGFSLSADSVRALGASQVAFLGRRRNQVSFEATRYVAEAVAARPHVRGVEPYVQAQDPGYGMRIFPPGSGFGRDHYGPLYVPARGDTLTIDASNWLLYKDLIIRYERHTARLLPDGVSEIDSVRTTRYVVEQDYFFVLGDNRDSSVDSRVWGFVPFDHVVGKALLVYFSWDPEKKHPRFERFFMGID